MTNCETKGLWAGSPGKRNAYGFNAYGFSDE